MSAKPLFFLEGESVILYAWYAAPYPMRPHQERDTLYYFFKDLGSRARAFAGHYDHNWTPYWSKSEQRDTEFCATCGALKELHPPSPITHAQCDNCANPAPRDDVLIKHVDILLPPFPLNGVDGYVQARWEVARCFFCSEECYNLRMHRLPRKLDYTL